MKPNSSSKKKKMNAAIRSLTTFFGRFCYFWRKREREEHFLLRFLEKKKHNFLYK